MIPNWVHLYINVGVVILSQFSTIAEIDLKPTEKILSSLTNKTDGICTLFQMTSFDDVSRGMASKFV